MKVPMLIGGAHVVFLLPPGTVPMPDEAEFLEHVERAIDGRGNRGRVAPPTAVNDLGPGDVATRVGEHLHDEAASRGPPKAAPAELADRGHPGLGKRRRAHRLSFR